MLLVSSTMHQAYMIGQFILSVEGPGFLESIASAVWLITPEQLRASPMNILSMSIKIGPSSKGFLATCRISTPEGCEL